MLGRYLPASQVPLQPLASLPTTLKVGALAFTPYSAAPFECLTGSAPALSWSQVSTVAVDDGGGGWKGCLVRLSVGCACSWGGMGTLAGCWEPTQEPSFPPWIGATSGNTVRLQGMGEHGCLHYLTAADMPEADGGVATNRGGPAT